MKVVSLWVNSSIADVVHAGFLRSFSHVLIASVDSTLKLSESNLKRELATKAPSTVALGSGLLVLGNELSDVAFDLKLFHGFDEVWCFEKKPSIAKPINDWIMPPLDIKLNQISSELLDWFLATECQLGLGDGVGMNVVSASEKYTDLIKGMNI